MQDVTVSLWVGPDQDAIEQYTVAVEDGVVDTEEAIERARERAESDGYDEVDLKEIAAA